MSSFRRVITVVLENASRDTVLTNKYMRDLRKKGVFLANSHCVTHPSQPNYFTMVGGDTLGITDDVDGWVYWTQNTQPTTPSGDAWPDVTSIVDLLEAKGLSWKAYAEDFNSSYLPTSYVAPMPPYAFQPTIAPVPPADSGNFVRRHVPFLSFPNIVNNPARAARIVDENQFRDDLKNKTLPHYSFYTPNVINDGHTASTDPFSDHGQLDNVEKFLKEFLSDDPIAKFPPETLIVITFDESYGADAHYNIYTLLIGDMLEAGTVCHEPYNHYSLLRTIEDNFGLGTLGRNDSAARPYWFVKQHYCS